MKPYGPPRPGAPARGPYERPVVMVTLRSELSGFIPDAIGLWPETLGCASKLTGPRRVANPASNRSLFVRGLLQLTCASLLTPMTWLFVRSGGFSAVSPV